MQGAFPILEAILNRRNTSFWSRETWLAIAAIPIIAGSLVALAILLRKRLDWPSPSAEPTLLIGVLILSVLPVILILAAVVVTRGGKLEYGGIKLDFGTVPDRGQATPTFPTNMGVVGNNVSETSIKDVLDSLRAAFDNDVVVVDFGDGTEWWETRLLVLLEGARRLERPKAIVFVALDRSVSRRFEGWGVPSALLARMLSARPDYEKTVRLVRAAAAQWEILYDVPTNPPPFQPTGLAAQYLFLTHPPVGPQGDDLAPEQLLALKLSADFETQVQPEQLEISLPKLESLFRPVLHDQSVETNDPPEIQLRAFLVQTDEFVAITHGGVYQRLLSRMAGLSAIVRTLLPP